MNDSTLETRGYCGKVVIVGRTDPQSWIERCKDYNVRVQVGTMTDRLERWLSFPLRRWTEPTTGAGEPCTERGSRYVRGRRKGTEGRWEDGVRSEVRVLAETVPGSVNSVFFAAISLAFFCLPGDTLVVHRPALGENPWSHSARGNANHPLRCSALSRGTIVYAYTWISYKSKQKPFKPPPP